MIEQKSSWFKGIRGRLLLAAFVPLIGFAVLFGAAVKGSETLVHYIAEAHELIIPTLQTNSGMRQSSAAFGYNAFAAISNIDAGRPHEAFLTAAKKSQDEFEEFYKGYLSTELNPEEVSLHEQVKPAIQEYQQTAKQILQLVELKDSTSLSQARILLSKNFVDSKDAVLAFNQRVDQIYADKAKSDERAAETDRNYVLTLISMIAACSAILIFGLLIWIGISISKSVGKIAANLQQSSRHVSTSVEQLKEAGNTLSHSSTSAAASLEETVASLEELTSMVQMNSDNAKQAAVLSGSSRDEAEQGEHEIKNLIASMSEISKSSKKIEEIIQVIDDIAFQTNLLALNAAVEAARAGEQGKGFAVVAEAVRALSQRSAGSAKDISILIKESVAQINEGSEIADKSGVVLSHIVTSIKKVSDLNNEISAASAEQTAGIQQISKAMNQLDQASQSNAASAEEIAATSAEINNLAQETQHLATSLNEVILGSHANHSADHSPGVQAKATPKKMAAPKSSVKSAPAASVKPTASAKVVPFKKTAPAAPPSKATRSQDILPFDEDVRKVGTTDGF